MADWPLIDMASENGQVSAMTAIEGREVTIVINGEPSVTLRDTITRAFDRFVREGIEMGLLSSGLSLQFESKDLQGVLRVRYTDETGDKEEVRDFKEFLD